MNSYTLSNNVSIPELGFGTWQTPNGDVAVSAVKKALEVGYRHIDTAQGYKNEDSVGQAIKESGIPREEIFLTTKLWNENHSYDLVLSSFEESLKKLQTDYIDLFLIHWPNPVKFRDNWQSANAETWRAMEELYQAGKIKAIGVSNFQSHHLKKLLATAKVKPVLNQVELHPKLAQKELRDYCQQQGIKIQAWSPLMQGQILQHPILVKMAQRHHVSPAQIALRWHIQQDILLVVKTVNPDRMEQNQQLFDFSLSEEDMRELNRLNEDHRVGPDPDQFNFN